MCEAAFTALAADATGVAFDGVNGSVILAGYDACAVEK